MSLGVLLVSFLHEPCWFWEPRGGFNYFGYKLNEERGYQKDPPNCVGHETLGQSEEPEEQHSLKTEGAKLIPLLSLDESGLSIYQGW